MPFKSEAQRRYFYYKASQPGAEGKKWKKHLRKYKESTPKGVKLPERVKTAAETYYHGSRYKIRKLRKGAYVTPYKEDALSFAVPWSTDDLEYAGGPDGRPPSKLKFKKRPPRDHKIYLYKVKAPVKKAKTNTGVSYDWNRVTTSAADLELVKTIPSWKKELLVKTASRAKGLAKFRHMTRDIQSLADASLHSPDVLLWRSIGRDGPIERRIVIGAPVEHQGARFKTPFYSSTGTGSKNVQSGEMIPFNWVEGKKPSKDWRRKKGQGIWMNKYFAKKQPPPGHPLHLQKLRLEAMDRKGLLTPTHVVDEYKMGAGRRYAGPLAVNAWLRERGHHRNLLPEVQSDLQSIVKYIEGRTMKTKTSAQNAFEYSFFEEIDKIANELSKTEKAIYTLPALGTLAGAAFGAASPEAFHPESMFPKIVKKHGLSSARARALSAMLGAGTGATLASIPAMAYDVVQMHRPRKKKKESK